ncbi:lysylphosphatidylglycerol synthase transmembrane domain-containing protein [Candidatus Methylomirabilis limnetica]|uniref:lysylphosphatidylglycerol synthase transmembrane domain-containing protein n=1 Tax=Candidatus Methylomirabilis limnetica TaxID=2033718 RepID=UPI001379DB4E|nr:lysylphosphatidylglycerol synthase transmembrane domain-containing protein [Candidatus Methylomirabilis limnetica]
MAKTSFRWLRLIGILLFIWIVFQINWITVWKLLKEIRPVYVVGYFVVFFIAVLLKVVRLRWFLYRLGYRVAFRDVYQSVIEPAFYGMVTPARIGEFSKVMYLTRFGLSARLAWGVVLMERLVDFSVLLMASVAGVFYFMIFGVETRGLTLVVFLALVVVLYVCLINIGGLSRLGSRVMGLFPWKHPAYNDLSSLGEGLARLGRLAASLFFPFSLAILILSFVQLWFLGLALEVSVSGLYLGLAYASSSLVSLLPLSVGGLGTREAVYIGLLHRQGVSSDMAITISLLDGLVFSMMAQLILLIPIAWKRN